MIIRVLPDQVVNQIAAGEVVERPASVVKELVENSLDAGATRIEVSLQAGGTERIRITDDGSGMDREDAMMCLERHATSKITATEDLESIHSLGFRGEAIPSIASVSRFSLLSRTRDTDVGVKVTVEGGTVISARAAGCAAGTEIDVRELFFNLPARRKFLRTRSTELSHCLEALARQALIRPDVAFRVTHDGRVVMSADVTDGAGRARQVLGDDGQRLVPVAFSQDGITVRGFASPTGVHRPSGKSLYLYVNGRFVKDAVVRRGVQEAYRDRIPRGRTPLLVLELSLDPAAVDVNVHPAKTEVRFQNPREVQAFLSEGLHDALARAGESRELGVPTSNRAPRDHSERAPSLPLVPVRPAVSAHPDDDPTLALAPDWLVDLHPRWEPPPFVAPTPVSPPEEEVQAPTPPPMAAEPDRPAVTTSSRALRPIGPFGTRWILCEGEQELVVVDHVRADALLAERRLRDGARAQRLLVPIRQRLSPEQVAVITARAESLSELGIQVVGMSPTEIAIRTLPAELERLHVDGLLAKLAEATEERAAWVLANAQTPPEPPTAARLRSVLLSLEEAGLDAVTRRIPASELL